MQVYTRYHIAQRQATILTSVQREELKGMIMESVRVLEWFCMTALFSNGACIAKAQ